MFPEDFQITTELLIGGILIFALIDAVFVPFMVWFIQPVLFRKIKWIQVVVAGIIWLGIWRWAIVNFWNTVYKHVFPDWGQDLIPPLFGLLMAIIALGLWALALQLRLHPVLGYISFGGLVGVSTHIWALYQGIVETPPMLQGASPVAAVVIAFFEFSFYWCVILSLSVMIYRLWVILRKLKNKRMLESS